MIRKEFQCGAAILQRGRIGRFPGEPICRCDGILFIRSGRKADRSAARVNLKSLDRKLFQTNSRSSRSALTVIPSSMSVSLSIFFSHIFSSGLIQKVQMVRFSSGSSSTSPNRSTPSKSCFAISRNRNTARCFFHFCGSENAPGIVPSAFPHFPNKSLCVPVRDNAKTSKSFSIR